MPLGDAAHLVVAILAIGMGLASWLTDPADRINRALALCLVIIGLLQALEPAVATAGRVFWTLVGEVLESSAILAGMEWGRRIGRSARGRRGVAAHWLFRVSQLLTVVLMGLSAGYVLIAPEQATSDAGGLIKVRGIEFAIFAPVLGSALTAAGIAIVLLLTTRLDSTDALRLRMLYMATPFLIGALVFSHWVEPYLVAVGLVILSASSVRYLTILGRRGDFMGQFLSPQVAQEVRAHGLDHLLERRRTVLTVVVADLRGFSAYARERASDEIFGLLESFYQAVGDAARAHGGTVKDHAGDGVVILVGAPFQVTHHARRGIELAFTLQSAVRDMLIRDGHAPRVGLGIGLATGRVTVGALRGAGRLEYGAVGNPVVLAARLCNRAADGEILADTRTRDEAGGGGHWTAVDQPPETLKGFPRPVPICALRLQTVGASGETIGR
ncbi:adenylate/guanylate cyclase domain-containing protein [uncultured Abyssibacter sp.]|uniref:adenylate/guanylate cyclase domain-containing protein n=1 Tax=uncultured Abyssibacter sp. TaxID=2320202 RepID=UPI0032B309E3